MSQSALVDHTKAPCQRQPCMKYLVMQSHFQRYWNEMIFTLGNGPTIVETWSTVVVDKGILQKTLASSKRDVVCNILIYENDKRFHADANGTHFNCIARQVCQVG